jgi:hypothetical protein
MQIEETFYGKRVDVKEISEGMFLDEVIKKLIEIHSELTDMGYSNPRFTTELVEDSGIDHGINFDMYVIP